MEPKSVDAPIPIVLPADLYWQIRALGLEHQQLVQRCQQTITQSSERQNALLVKAGLDPKLSYRLNDSTLEATAAS